MKKKKITVKELVWHIIGGVIWVCGLAWAVTGLVGSYLKVGNGIDVAESDFIAWSKINLSFEAWGFILLAIGTLILVINLFYFAKKADTDTDRASKRLQRLGK